MQRLTIFSVSVFGLSMFVAACTTSVDSPPSGPAKEAPKEGTNTSDVTGAKPAGGGATENAPAKSEGSTGNPADPAPPAKTGDAATCKATKAVDECYSCCGETKTTWDKADAVVEACFCETTCKDACKSADWCSENGDKVPACNECIDASCTKAYQEACMADPACKAVLTCVEAAGCNEKPGGEVEVYDAP
jgi:hypothetical protein